jgi:hypothetical protein
VTVAQTVHSDVGRVVGISGSLVVKDQVTEGRGRVGLHARDDVRVDLHRESDGVSETFADDLAWDAGLEQQCRVRVAKVM